MSEQKVKRYNIGASDYGEPIKAGMYVLAADFDRVEAERDALQAQFANADRDWRNVADVERIAALEKAIKNLRRLGST